MERSRYEETQKHRKPEHTPVGIVWKKLQGSIESSAFGLSFNNSWTPSFVSVARTGSWAHYQTSYLQKRMRLSWLALTNHDKSSRAEPTFPQQIATSHKNQNPVSKEGRNEHGYWGGTCLWDKVRSRVRVSWQPWCPSQDPLKVPTRRRCLSTPNIHSWLWDWHLLSS